MKHKSRSNEIYPVPWTKLIVLGFMTIAGVASLFAMGAGGSAEGFVSEGIVDIAAGQSTRILGLDGTTPGDVSTIASTVENNGTLDFRYGVVSRTTEDTLAAQLLLTVKTGVEHCTEEGIALTGTVVYGPARLGSVAGTNVVGDPRNSGRTLVAGEQEILCLQVSLPLDTGNGYQGLETSATLTFWAQQADEHGRHKELAIPPRQSGG